MEANRASAEELIARAKAAAANGKDEEALRLIKKSLSLFVTAQAKDLQDHLIKFGPGSPAAAVVSRVLAAGGAHYRVLNLDASGARNRYTASSAPLLS